MNKAKSGLVSSIQKYFRDRCKVSCSGSSLPVAIMHEQNGGSFKERTFPKNQNSFYGAVATAICPIGTPKKGIIKAAAIGIYLKNASGKLKPVPIKRTIIFPYYSNPESLSIIK